MRSFWSGDSPFGESDPFALELRDIFNIGIFSHDHVIGAAEERVDGDRRVGHALFQADQKRRRRRRVDVDRACDHRVAPLLAHAEAPPIDFQLLLFEKSLADRDDVGRSLDRSVDAQPDGERLLRQGER
jgi:hypothetical protein